MKKSIKKISFFLLLFLISTDSFSQRNTIKVIGIKGTSIISGNTTLNQARDEALIDAQRNALKAAGIEEHIQSNMLLLKFSDNESNSKYFTKEVQTLIEGSILDLQIIDTTIVDLKVIITINATVIRYNTKPDINFDVQLTGIKNVYNNNDSLTFNIKTSTDCYLKIFSIIEDQAILLYPSKKEFEQKFISEIVYHFPLIKIAYRLEVDHDKTEKGRFVFVFTKSPIKFIQMNEDQVTATEKINSWINSIPLDQKKIVTNQFFIQF